MRHSVDLDPSLICRTFFELDFPPTEEGLRDKFRDMTLRGRYRHPDLGGTSEDFVELRTSYEFLLGFCDRSSFIESSVQFINGIPITEFGRGLGPTTNGIACEFCNGKGFYSATRLEHIYDPRACRSCRGMGSFISQRLRVTVCSDCNGFGRNLLGRENRTHHYTCHKCKGVGEISIFNPAFQKGGLNVTAKAHVKSRRKKVKGD